MLKRRKRTALACINVANRKHSACCIHQHTLKFARIGGNNFQIRTSLQYIATKPMLRLFNAVY